MMQRTTSPILFAFAALLVALGISTAKAASSHPYKLEGTYGAAWRSFSVYSATSTPAVNTYSMKFATGIQMDGNNVRLASNGGRFIRNGRSRPINQTVYAHVDLRVKPATIGSHRKQGRRGIFKQRNSRPVKVPVVGHAGRFVGKLFSRSNRRSA